MQPLALGWLPVLILLLKTLILQQSRQRQIFSPLQRRAQQAVFSLQERMQQQVFQAVVSLLLSQVRSQVPWEAWWDQLAEMSQAQSVVYPTLPPFSVLL